MKSLRNSLLRFAPLAVAALMAAPVANAAGTWSSNWLSGLTCTSGTLNTCSNASVEVTAWSTSGTGTGTATAGLGSGATFAQANVGVYGTHLGVRNTTEIAAVGGVVNNVPEPQHAMDSSGQNEFLLIHFLGGTLQMSSLQIGYSNNDSDLSVMRLANDNGLSTLNGKTAAQMLTNGWSLVGSPLSNVAINTSTAVAASSGSSWWLVSAFNSNFGGTTGDTAFDAVKLMAIAGTVTPPNNIGVPEPASLALAGVALVAMVGAGRRRKSKQV